TGPGAASPDCEDDYRRRQGFYAALSAGRQLSPGGDHRIWSAPGGAHGLSQRAPAQSALRCGRGGKIPTLGWGSINGAAMQHSPGITLGSRAPTKSAGAIRHTRSVKAGEVGVERYTPTSVV